MTQQLTAKAQLTGRVLPPKDPGWNEAREGFAAWAPYDRQEPITVVFCQDTGDVQNAIKYVRENHLPFRVRAGRHNYEAYSSLVKGGVVIDVSELDSVRVSRDAGTATIGAGIAMVDMYEALGEVGVTLPGATGASVGLAGLTLGGGFGVTSRKWGLMCDNLLEVKVVDAHGNLLVANETENPNLYWACRGGGGGNFGIATEFTFKVHEIGTVVLFEVNYLWEAFEAVVDAFQHWAPTTDDSISSILMLAVPHTVSQQAPKIVKLYGQYTPDSDLELPRIQELLAPMLQIPPISINIQTLPAIMATRVMLGLNPISPVGNINPHTDQQIFKSSSGIVNQILSLETIQLMKKHLEAVPLLSSAPSQPSMLQLLGAGGAVNRVPKDATAMYYRDATFVIQFDAYWTAPQDGMKTIAWAEEFRVAMLPYTVGAYVNYVDHYIKDYLKAYYAGNLPRLVDVKKQYDPENFFKFPQSIPTHL
ncbi:FAD-binding oxidoreductase [Deinococcus roseus]|uniref:FAD-binding protein n=1 Tax=Deinococcus roseus TaxID=392414 RepID=A0ABQ2DAY5_9DEIO|nr:FAD-binding oxidoreductase [Deinococcus roseus]GGJ49797.1 FAD-binding protein [Deinococcus roseus]